MKVASVINNYINYMAEHKRKLFLKFIFPKLYGVTAEEAIEEDIVPEDTKLESDKNIIDIVNQYFILLFFEIAKEQIFFIVFFELKHGFT